MRSLIILAIVFIVAPAQSKTLLAPESFVTQIKVNEPRLRNWSRVYLHDGHFRQVAFSVTVEDMDVVPAQSLLRPYLGKARLVYRSKHGRFFPTAAEAEASPPPTTEQSSEVSECEVTFIPVDLQWKYQEARCRSTVLRQWMLMDRDELEGSPLGDMLKQFESAPPASSSVKSRKP